MSLKHHLGIAAIVLLFIFTNLVFLNFYSDVWWDSSVYIGMGKHIFSNGKTGLWEESRPLIFPLILGIGSKLNLDEVYFGRLVSIAFAVLVVFMVYIIGIKLFSRKVGLLSAFFTSFSSTFLFFSPNILTEIPSLFFVLLAFYFFLENRFFLMGLFSGIAVMTRLFQVFTLIGMYMAFFAYSFKKPGFSKKVFYIIVGASIFILPYFLLNYHLYADILLPFTVQSHLTKTTGWMLYREFGFYFAGLLKENFFLVFLAALPLFFKRDYKFYALVSIPAFYLLIFSYIKHKEMRFMIQILPFLYLLASYCVFQLYKKLPLKKHIKGIFYAGLILWLFLTFASFKDIILYKHQRDDDGIAYFQFYLKNNNGMVWITNPIYALYSNAKIDGLLYFYSSGNLIRFIESNKDNVDIVLFNSCDIPCPPDDDLCIRSRKILNGVLHNLDRIYQKEIDSCEYQIFRRTTSSH